MSEQTSSFPISIDIPVAWGDMDALGHVNNTKYFRYFESARIAYFRAVGMTFDPQGPILASTTCDYLLPVEFPDTVRVEVGVTRVGNASFTMAYRLHSRAHDALAARGTAVCVWYDYTQKRSAPIPADVRARMEALEQGSAG